MSRPLSPAQALVCVGTRVAAVLLMVFNFPWLMVSGAGVGGLAQGLAGLLTLVAWPLAPTLARCAIRGKGAVRSAPLAPQELLAAILALAAFPFILVAIGSLTSTAITLRSLTPLIESVGQTPWRVVRSQLWHNLPSLLVGCALFLGAHPLARRLLRAAPGGTEAATHE